MAEKIHKVMTVGNLQKMLAQLVKNGQIDKSWEINLSSDEEGNDIEPMLKDPECCLGLDDEKKKITFYPSRID